MVWPEPGPAALAVPGLAVLEQAVPEQAVPEQALRKWPRPGLAGAAVGMAAAGSTAYAEPGRGPGWLGNAAGDSKHNQAWPPPRR